MGKLNRNQREQALRKKKKEIERLNVEKNFRKAPYIKQVCRHRGCDLPFYEFLDSFEEEFHRTAAAALATHKSLLGIYELNGDEYLDNDWKVPGSHEPMTKINWDMDDAYADYGQKDESDPKAFNLAGNANAFLTSSGELRTVVRVRRDIEMESFQHSSFKYSLKIATLLHEVAHVDDIERQLNFNTERNWTDIIEAEVYANLACLEGLATRHMRATYGDLIYTLKAARSLDGYISQVATKVIERVPDHTMVGWSEIFFESPLTEQELKMIGQQGRDALSGSHN